MTYTQNFIVYFPLDDLGRSFQTSSQAQKFSLTVFARDQTYIYRDLCTSILPKAYYASLWNPASAEYHLKMSTGLAWLSLTGMLWGIWPPQCVVLSWFWVQFPNCTSEKGFVCHLTATQKHEQKDLINFLLNCCLSNVMITFSRLQISFQCLSLVHFS